MFGGEIKAGANCDAFGRRLLENLIGAPFGSLTKSEMNVAVFDALVEAEIVDINAPKFDLACELQLTTAQVDALRYAYRLRRPESFTRAIRVARVDAVPEEKDNPSIVLNVEDKYTRNAVVSELKKLDIFAKDIIQPETITLRYEEFRLYISSLGSDGDDLGAALDQVLSAAKAKRVNKSKTTATILLEILKSAGKGAASEAGSKALDYLPHLGAVVDFLRHVKLP